MLRKAKKFRELKDDNPDSPMEEPSRPGIRDEPPIDTLSTVQVPTMVHSPSVEQPIHIEKSPTAKEDPLVFSPQETKDNVAERNEFRGKVNLSNIIIKPIIRNFGIEQDTSLKKVLNLRLHSPGTASPILIKPGFSWSRDGESPRSPISPREKKYRDSTKNISIPQFNKYKISPPERQKKSVHVDALMIGICPVFETEGNVTLDEIRQNFSGVFTEDEFFEFDYYNMIPLYTTEHNIEYIGCKPKNVDFNFKYLKHLMNENKSMRISIDKSQNTIKQLSVENEQIRQEIEIVHTKNQHSEEIENLRKTALHYERLLQDTLSVLRQLKIQQEILNINL